MSRPDPEQLQGTLVDFALLELIRQHRESFQPLWSVDSWAKLMIWLSLNCGLSGERDSLEHFAAALGERITSRLRRTFFERELADLELQVPADPAEQQVLLAHGHLTAEYMRGLGLGGQRRVALRGRRHHRRRRRRVAAAVGPRVARRTC